MAANPKQSVDTGATATTADAEQSQQSNQTQNSEQVGEQVAAKKPKPPGKRVPAKNPNMARRGRPAAGEETIKALEQRRNCLEYRKMGLSYEQIGQKIGISPQAAWQNVDRALRDITQEPAKEVRKLELERLDAMFIPVYGNAMRGDLMALNSALSIMNRRAKLLGLDAPVKTDNKTEISGEAAGVFVLSPVMSPEDWSAAAKAQQAALVKDTQASPA